ncbi:hypothetical protein DRE_07617 [Drechslerella stenobrocha 248]|uniref:Proteasome assembly chaperone 3 n=1 Tax=Drechslerella stenobrocha 248 TaxID=1043628 RepID=W7HHT1_9PEZI|nr:hypothetical protein DRE_07617 [Drechslerella stenobrocha 248]
MADVAQSEANGVASSGNEEGQEKVHQLAVAVPYTADTTRLHIHLTVAARHLRVFLSTTSSGGAVVTGGADAGAGGEILHPMRTGDVAVPRGKVAVGSFVYAMPLDGGRETVCTVLVAEMATAETAERMARILARRVRRPVYLGSSVAIGAVGMGGGGSVEEEAAVVAAVVKAVTEVVR